MKSLQGKTALVTGGSRGAGRGIALELAKAGAYVYVTGRTTAAEAAIRNAGDIDSTIREIHDEGGEGTAIRCDHTIDVETERVIRQIEAERGRLDILVNNVWGGNELSIDIKPFWEQPVAHWDNMFTSGVRGQLMTNYYAIPLMRRNSEGGIIIHTTYWDDYKYIGNFYYDLSKNALVRMAFGLSEELRADGIAVIPLSPGWMRTELVLRSLNTDEEHWREVEELHSSESTHYIGRAVCALAADPSNLIKSGHPQQVGVLAIEYGFTDIDGRQVPVFKIPE
ncbi:SDR family NAD(P)-dependent oxidoreductase [Paenibacillus sp. sgz500958]|uniref:SDR family NAD(P)-dependent oxidoreductase n=1 Tax=Paenibacillus sp. sgz500958 TaxID=3242475 RepID=UPI0036D295B0